MEINKKNKLKQRYNNSYIKYETLGKNLKESIEILLKDENIEFIDVKYRTKTFHSFRDKVESKNYRNPFNEIEDICGLRIVCFHPGDIKKISKIIKKEFDIVNFTDKSGLLEDDRFGYRSYHLVVSIKKQWANIPNYKHLKDLKAEIQIRTIMMHAWAEIEHKLSYKSESQTPKELQRDLFALAAMLENADNQFEKIKLEKDKYRKKLLSKNSKSLLVSDLNLDSFLAFLDKYFPGRKKDVTSTANLLEEMKLLDISLKEIFVSYDKFKDYVFKFEEEFIASGLLFGSSFTEVGIMRMLLLVTNDSYNKMKMKNNVYSKGARNVIEKWRDKIKN